MDTKGAHDNFKRGPEARLLRKEDIPCVICDCGSPVLDEIIELEDFLKYYALPSQLTLDTDDFSL